MRFGVCTGVDQLAEVATAGFDYVEVSTGHLLPQEDEAAFAGVRQAVEAASIGVEACNCFVPGHIKVVGPAVDLAVVRAHMDLVLRRASELGAKIMVFGSGDARRIPEGYSRDRGLLQFQDALALAGDIAGQYDMTIALEPLEAHGTNLIFRVDEGAQVVRAVNHPRVKLLADLYHMAAEQEPFSNIPPVSPLLAHVHVTMPNVPAIRVGEPTRHPEYFAALADAGYDGRVSIEHMPFSTDVPINVLRAMARDYFASLTAAPDTRALR